MNSDTAATTNSPPVVTTGVKNTENIKTFTFKKVFAFNFESRLLEYVRDNKNHPDYVIAFIKTYVHTLPWQYIYFYLTPKEFHDIQSGNHTARVKHVKLKIVNLGNRTPFITGTRSVSYANANSQTTIGIWEEMEELGPFQCGNNIRHRELYGLSYKYNDNFKKASSNQEIHHKDHGACQQPILVDNRGTYLIHVASKEQDAEIPMNDETYFLPALIAHSKIMYNATNSIGEIYSKEYTPKDGTIHKFNNGMTHLGTVPRIQNPLEQLSVETGRITQPPLTRIGILTQSRYETTTIDNLYFAPLQGTPADKVCHSLGIGILPLINPDHKMEKSLLSIIVHTEITIEAESHGTNVLMDYNTYPQPNTYKISMRTQANEFVNMYGMSGLPIVSVYNEGMDYDSDDDPGIIPDNRFSTSWGHTIVHDMKPTSIPGQRRVTGRMTFAQRIDIFKANLQVRIGYLETNIAEGTTVNIIENVENAQYAIPKGNGRNIPKSTDEFWNKLAKVGRKDYTMTSEDKKLIPKETTSQTSNFTGTVERSTTMGRDRHHLPLGVYE